MADKPIVYCRCAYAQVVPEDTKNEVLEGLCGSGTPFESVSDLCEMSARRDPRLKELADSGAVRIVACHPRAVKGLFGAAGAGLSEEATIHNMREETATDLLGNLFNEGNDAGA